MSLDHLVNVSDAMLRRELVRLARQMVFGTIAERARVCGKPTCRCAQGEKHPAHYLTRKVGRKTHSLYIPVALVEEVRQWNQEHRRLKRLVAEICERQRAVVKRLGVERRRKPPPGP